MLVYAVPADLVNNAWCETAPSNAAALLRAASQLVTRATRLDMYNVYPVPTGTTNPVSTAAGTAVGSPYDPTVAQAFNDATCQQALFWSLNGINPDAGYIGQSPIVASQSVEDGSVTYAQGQTQDWLKLAVTTLCDAACDILRNAGLVSEQPSLL